MTDPMPSTPQPLQAITLVETQIEVQNVCLLIRSLRLFGGPLSQSPVWVFYPPEPDLTSLAPALTGLDPVQPIPLDLDLAGPASDYPFASKVAACAQAESLAGDQVRALLWLNPECLILNPPLLFDLAPAFDAAFRPVHHTNIGSPAQDPLDRYWATVYRTVGLDEAPFTIESFADAQALRPYFNTHCFSINPAVGLLAAWREHFQALVSDPAFQSGPCRGPLQRIFLHQALLSVLTAKNLGQERIRLLPPEYSYPLHLHPQVPPSRRPARLNDLVCPVYEDAFVYPAALNGLGVDQPLRSWLAEHSG